MDKRKTYYLIVDTETANTFNDESGKLDTSSGLVYDCGFAIIDRKGKVYETRSFVNSDIFIHEKEMMKSAYYADKIPNYWKQIWAGERKVADTLEIRSEMHRLMKKYGVKVAVAHNARFDTQVLNMTARYITKSYIRFWFPYGTEVWDTLMMARSVIGKMPSYEYFCEKYDRYTKTGQKQMTAEVLYQFITNNPEFKESHTGLEDVMIEKEIFAYCVKQHKAMRKILYKGA